MRALATKFRAVGGGPSPGLVRTLDAGRSRSSTLLSFKPPVKGLMLFDDISAVPDGGALVLENFVCGAGSVRARGGSVLRSFGVVGPVAAMMTYYDGPKRECFTIRGGVTQGLYDITLPGTMPAPLVTGLTPSIWSTVQFSTSGDVFLVACSAGNNRLLYDGTTWGTTPAITGVAMNTLSHVWSHGRRLFFVENGTQNAWYLPVDSVGGAAVKFPLGGEFKLGGSLVSGASWTSDAGSSGLKSMCCFMSSEGEVAIYEGADPTTWTSIGVYQIAKPCGINCFLKTGGDLAVMTEDGLLAMSQAVALDSAALVNAAVSRNIQPIWRAAVASTDIAKWTITRWDSAGYAIVSYPPGPQSLGGQFVVNLQTGAWSTFKGWQANTMVLFEDELLFSIPSGNIFRGDVNGADDGSTYTASYIGPFRMARGGGVITAKAARAVVRVNSQCQPAVSALFDYSTRLPTAPSACLPGGGALWNSATWNSGAVWGGGKAIRDDWQSVSGTGSVIAPCVQYTFGQVPMPSADLLRSDIMIETGAVVA